MRPAQHTDGTQVARIPHSDSPMAHPVQPDDADFRRLLTAIEQEEVPQRLLDLARALQDRLRTARQDQD